MSRFSIEKSSVSVETFLGETFCAVFRKTFRFAKKIIGEKEGESIKIIR